jgi:acyl-coenzyme A thioesterase PaaI-like protein
LILLPAGILLGLQQEGEGDYSMKQKQPNSAECFVCGVENKFGLKLKFYDNGPGKVVCEHLVPEQYNGYPGVVHGGIVAAMLDEALARSFMSGNPERFMYTAKLTARYRKPVPTEQPIRLEGEVVKDRGRIGEARAWLYGPDGDLLAEGEAMLVNLPENVLAESDLDTLGWKVYPDEEVAG